MWAFNVQFAVTDNCVCPLYKLSNLSSLDEQTFVTLRGTKSLLDLCLTWLRLSQMHVHRVGLLANGFDEYVLLYKKDEI